MSTRGRICVKLEEGGIISNWVGHDAYITGVGAYLNRFVTTYEQALKLITGGGEICSLYIDYIDDVDVPEVEYYDDVNIGFRWKAYTNEQQLIDDYESDVFMEYVYLFKDDVWFVYSRRYDEFVELKQVLEEIGREYETRSMNEKFN